MPRRIKAQGCLPLEESPLNFSSPFFQKRLGRIAPAVYRKILLESYSLGDAFNEEAHNERVYKCDHAVLYERLKHACKEYCQRLNFFLAMEALARPRDSHKRHKQDSPFLYRTRLKPGIDTEA
jgi:hypothetical protein